MDGGCPDPNKCKQADELFCKAMQEQESNELICDKLFKWQPIATAPKGIVLGVQVPNVFVRYKGDDGEYYATEAWYDTGNETWVFADGVPDADDITHEVTHWMHKPDEPNE